MVSCMSSLVHSSSFSAPSLPGHSVSLCVTVYSWPLSQNKGSLGNTHKTLGKHRGNTHTQKWGNTREIHSNTSLPTW